MDPEYGVSAHDLHVSIFEVERFVTSGRSFFTELGWGQVGYSGDTQCGGRDGGGWGIEGLGGRFHGIQDGRRLDALQGGGRDIGIDCGDGEILRNECDGSFDLCRDFDSHNRFFLFFPLVFFILRDISLLSFLLLFLLEPCGMDFAKLLTRQVRLLCGHRNG